MNNFNPTVSVSDAIIRIGDSVAVSSLLQTADRDGNPIETYRFLDPTGGGYYTLNGVLQSSGSFFDVTAADIGNLRYHAGTSPASEETTVQVYDGGRWSAPATALFYSVTGQTRAPEVTGVDQFTEVAFEKTLLSDLFSTSDPDGYPIVRYRFRDDKATTGGGYIEVGGKAISQGQWTVVQSHQLDTAYYVAAKNQHTENVLIRSYDGSQWSSVKRIQADTTRNANRPIVSTSEIVIRSQTSQDLNDTFQVRDEDNSTIKKYRFYDVNGNSSSGYVEVNGVKQQAGKWITLTAEQFNNARFVASRRSVTDKVRIRAFDGKFWSSIKSIDFVSLEDPRVVVNDNTILDEHEVISIRDLITGQADSGPRIVEYEIIDMNSAARSGYLRYQGNRLAAGQIYTFNNRELNDLEFVGGNYDLRWTDQLKVRANNRAGVDRHFVGEWKNLNVFTEPNMWRSMTDPYDDNEDMVRSWEDFVAPGADGQLTITYSFNQIVPSYNDDPPPNANIPLNQNQRASVRTAFGLLDELLDVRFEEVSDTSVDPITGVEGGFIRIGAYFEDSPVLAYVESLPDDIINVPIAGDMWINNFYPENVISAGPGSSSFYTILHEIGHAIGLLHPHDGFPILSPQIDNGGLTFMSYAPSPNGAQAQHAMVYDAAVLGDIYGLDPTTRTGNDTYRVNGVRNQDLIYDAGGIDTLNVSNHSNGAIINLQQGQYSSIGVINNNIGIAYGTTIENARGTSSADNITGNEVVNRIWGGDGNDVITGRGGNDFYYGGAGSDRYQYFVGDQHNVINEGGKAGRDIIEVRMGNRFGLDDFTEDVSFRRLGRDLLVQFQTDGDDFTSGSLLIKNQQYGASRVETLRLYNDDGTQNGVSIDLTSVFVQANSTTTSFESSGVRGQYGFLVNPV